MLTTAITWGLFPLYLYLLADVEVWSITAHRIIWCALMAWTLVLLNKRHAPLTKQQRVGLLCTATLQGGFWLIYVWSVSHHHVIDLSLGYFTIPLMATLLSVLFLGERLTRIEWLAIALAAAGIALLVFDRGGLPLNGLAMALCFSSYATIRKRLGLGALYAFTIEMSLLAPFALAYLAYTAMNGESATLSQLPLLVGSAVVTLLPMVLYGVALRNIRLSTASMIQYLTPTLNFLCGLLFFAEPLEPLKLVTFVFIWSGLLIYTHAAIQRSRNGKT